MWARWVKPLPQTTLRFFFKNWVFKSPPHFPGISRDNASRTTCITGFLWILSGIFPFVRCLKYWHFEDHKQPDATLNSTMWFVTLMISLCQLFFLGNSLLLIWPNEFTPFVLRSCVLYFLWKDAPLSFCSYKKNHQSKYRVYNIFFSFKIKWTLSKTWNYSNLWLLLPSSPCWYHIVFTVIDMVIVGYIPL